MKEYLIKYYLDDEEKNPCKDCEVEIIKADNVTNAIIKIAEYLIRMINNNPFADYMIHKYSIDTDNNIILGVYNFTKSKYYIETYIIDSIEELR